MDLESEIKLLELELENYTQGTRLDDMIDR